jgi:hypothetical protein
VSVLESIVLAQKTKAQTKAPNHGTVARARARGAAGFKTAAAGATSPSSASASVGGFVGVPSPGELAAVAALSIHRAAAADPSSYAAYGGVDFTVSPDSSSDVIENMLSSTTATAAGAGANKVASRGMTAALALSASPDSGSAEKGPVDLEEQGLDQLQATLMRHERDQVLRHTHAITGQRLSKPVGSSPFVSSSSSSRGQGQGQGQGQRGDVFNTTTGSVGPRVLVRPAPRRPRLPQPPIRQMVGGQLPTRRLHPRHDPRLSAARRSPR